MEIFGEEPSQRADAETLSAQWASGGAARRLAAVDVEVKDTSDTDTDSADTDILTDTVRHVVLETAANVVLICNHELIVKNTQLSQDQQLSSLTSQAYTANS